eukprot:TRINITY_DN29173_c0_g1_i1.p1 TRINITY_DN29173_c0_g1~~TRINITY_DN29173_c0_g1_i1.p1  ORF type:complete len:290 (-),score=95.99 TRINITY_DN29173_c0_g1_i1:177-1046(-)
MSPLNYIVATRPWSFTVPVMGVLLTSALVHAQHGMPLLNRGCLEVMTLCICLQAAGNLLNSVFDYTYGVDNPATIGDRCLVDKKITVRGALLFALILATTGSWLVIPKLLAPDRQFLYVFLASIALAVSYTAPPFKLKYRAMGDAVIFICFGPLTMTGAAIVMTGAPQYWVLPYALPVTLLTEAILHANNTRDIKEDARCGIKTVAMLLGYQRSRTLYYAMVAGAYLSALALSMQYVGCCLVLLSVPLALSTLRSFSPPTMANMDEKTAQLHLLFSLLLNVGVYYSPAV